MTNKQPSGISTTYNPQEVEKRIYRSWLDGGFFTPEIDRTKSPFVIIQPPPNVTGELHLGHAQRATVEDILSRWHRMKGDPTLWLPGVDHAGIATQVVVERELANEGLSRHDIGREKFLQRMWEWVNKYRERIRTQQQRLGASCDWSREQFTLDPNPSKAVWQTFVNLYNKGLIYKGERIINWCPRCSTALSDLEVIHQEVQGSLYFIRYPFVQGTGFICVATTRPETILGDSAIAVNPDDSRYAKIHGEYLRIPILGREIPIITDETVETAFGTGALKVTPSHDPIDYEIGLRHNLESTTVIGLDGKMSESAGQFQGIDRFECREFIVQQLSQNGFLEKIEPHSHSVGHCQRCNQVVEPLISKQWFMHMAPLAKPAIEAVQDGCIRIIPEHFSRVYQNWMDNIKDWCISRQLWWGHRIPVWYCNNCSFENVSTIEPETCTNCGSTNLFQDPDVLDTWFSSGLWPHSTLGWPENTEDLDYFYPTAVMETGHDILFFWVARMIMLGLENTGKIPFHTVYLSGLIRDPSGIKMSKTKGNVIDPLQTIETYGCDALRFALTVGTTPGNDTRLGDDKLESARNFANKLWNATRFVLTSTENTQFSLGINHSNLTHLEDRWITSRLSRTTKRVQQALEDYQIGEAELAIYDFLWNEFCDWYIEVSKLRFGENEIDSPLPTLLYVLEQTLRLLHPFMPFVTEELWQLLKTRFIDYPNQPKSIMVADFPVYNPQSIDTNAEDQFETLMALIRAVRNIRSEFRIPPRKLIEVFVDAGDMMPLIQGQRPMLQALGRIEAIEFFSSDTSPLPGNSVTVVLGPITVSVPMEGIIDVHKELERLNEELKQTEHSLERLGDRIADPIFLSRAPDEVIERERERQSLMVERRSKIVDLLKHIGI